MEITINNYQNYNNNTNIISKIIEIINCTANKIKNFIKTNDELKFYYQLNEEFKKISHKLDDNEILLNELDAFLEIKDYVLNIVYWNCKDNTFGYIDFAINLLILFNELLSIKIKFLHEKINKEEYDKFHEYFEDELWESEKIFYTDIYKPILNIDTPEEFYEHLKEIKW